MVHVNNKLRSSIVSNTSFFNFISCHKTRLEMVLFTFLHTPLFWSHVCVSMTSCHLFTQHPREVYFYIPNYSGETASQKHYTNTNSNR